ncbi:serine/threonine-protein kinase RIO1 [Physcia stellaris]|nr:serine/threonine-protein kinase RIO1 [Physcia stellaris]
MSSSSGSPSPRSPSPEQQPTPLESLVSHLLASKRSLSSVSHVLRANELVTSTRKTLETNMITTARTQFLRSGIDEQVKVLEQCWDSTQSFTETNWNFAEEVLGVRRLLSQRKVRIFEDSAENAETISLVPDILTSMEDNAREMADNLESLVKHYDLCVSAIKHTEGGGDAAQRIAGESTRRAYDNLLIEVGRRKALEAKVEMVVQDAMGKVNKLYNDDFGAREAFKTEQGEFLPGDIWPDMMNGPLQYAIAPVDNSMRKVPEVPRSVIQQAMDRVRRRA